MKEKLLITNHALLFLCTSMYLGTGGSLVLFSFPVSSQLTPDNYYLQFVPQTKAATAFFIPMTKVLLACATVMLISEWRQPTRWIPIVVLAACVAATVITTELIFPLNAEMANHISDPERLHIVLAEWMNLSRIRMALWCVQWIALMWYFAHWAFQGRFVTSEQ